MIDTKRKEELSISYLTAICAYAAAGMEIHKHDDDGYDGSIRKIIKLKEYDFNSQIEFQLKSTSTRLHADNNFIHYNLKVKNYHDLIRPGTCASFLFLLVLPEEEDDWLTVTPQNLILRKCMYWLSLKEHDETSNENTIVVNIPKSNFLTSEKIIELLKQQVTEGDI